MTKVSGKHCLFCSKSTVTASVIKSWELTWVGFGESVSIQEIPIRAEENIRITTRLHALFPFSLCLSKNKGHQRHLILCSFSLPLKVIFYLLNTLCRLTRKQPWILVGDMVQLKTEPRCNCMVIHHHNYLCSTPTVLEILREQSNRHIKTQEEGHRGHQGDQHRQKHGAHVPVCHDKQGDWPSPPFLKWRHVHLLFYSAVPTGFCLSCSRRGSTEPQDQQQVCIYFTETKKKKKYYIHLIPISSGIFWEDATLSWSNDPYRILKVRLTDH